MTETPTENWAIRLFSSAAEYLAPSRTVESFSAADWKTLADSIADAPGVQTVIFQSAGPDDTTPEIIARSDAQHPAITHGDTAATVRLVAWPNQEGIALGPLSSRVPPSGRTLKLIVLHAALEPLPDDTQSALRVLASLFANSGHGQPKKDSRVFDALAKFAPDAIIRMDPTGTVLDFTGGAEAIFGYTSEEMIGQPVERLMPKAHAQRHTAYVDAFLKTGERKLPDFGRRLLAQRKDGSTFPVEIALSEVPGETGNDFIGVVRDVSVQAKNEASRDRTRRAIDFASRESLLNEMAATIAHELNQPLTAVANYMDALEMRLAAMGMGAEGEAAIELVRKASAQARLGGEIIRRTRHLAANSEVVRVPDDFHDAVGEAIALLRTAPIAEAVEITHRRSSGALPVQIDRVQIQQIVVNLATNAFNAMDKTGEKHLLIETDVNEDVATLTMADTGSGVAEEDRGRIFNGFYRTTHDGVGLGLTVAKRIADAHAGTLSLVDTGEKGATFRLQIPRTPPKTGEEETGDRS